MRVRHEYRSWLGRLILPWIPFVLVILLYTKGSIDRHAENAKDKMMPNLTQLAQGFEFAVQIRTPDGYRWDGWENFHLFSRESWKTVPDGWRMLLWEDTIASLKRLLLGLSLSGTLALAVGLHMGVFPWFEVLMLRFIGFFSFLPPLALLPLVCIYLVTGEVAKVAIVFLRTFFDLTQNFYLRILEVPDRYVFQSYAQGASTWEVAYKVCLMLKLPPILDTVRLAIRPAWVYLIASELIAAEAGLGYRIALVQRSLQVNVILWYILWIAFLGYLGDLVIRLVTRAFFPWASKV